MTTRHVMLDEAHDLFFQQQLTEIDAQLYETKRGNLEALQLVSTKPMNAGAETYLWKRYDARGVAKIMSNYATNSPGVKVSGTDNSSPLRSIRTHYGFSIQEIRAAMMAGVPLESLEAKAARRAIDEKLDQIALFGDAEWGLVGLFNQPNAQTYTVPADGTGATTTWSTKTADQIMRDIFGILEQIPTTTNEVEKPKRLVMPYSRLRQITRLRIDTLNNTTVLQFIQTMRPDVEIRGALRLDTAGAGGTARMVAYDPDREIVEWLVAIPFEQFPPQWNSLRYVIECHARAGGVVLRRPLSMAYGDGI